MKTIKCLHCGKESFGTDKRRYCSTSCRVASWQKKKRKQKLTRPQFAKVEVETVEQAQFRIIASLMTLEKAAKAEDELAHWVLNEIQRQLDNIKRKLR